MGMQNPQVSDPLNKLSDVFPEGKPFYMTGIRVVTATSAAYGKGEMVVVAVRGNDHELGVWGAYLLAQAKAVDASDLNQWYVIERRVVEGFGKGGHPVKAFTPAAAPTSQPVVQDTPEPDDSDDIPF